MHSYGTHIDVAAEVLRRAADLQAGVIVLGPDFCFFKQKTAYEIRPCDWSSDVCSSDLSKVRAQRGCPLTAWQNCRPCSSIASAWNRASPKSRSMSLTPPSLRALNCTPSSARRPDLVVMLMTPLPARAPYSDAPAAPFTTSTLSMSPGLMSGRAPLMITPSTM